LFLLFPILSSCVHLACSQYPKRRRPANNSRVPGRDQHASGMSGGQQDMVSGFPGPSLSPPLFSNNPTAAGARVPPVRSALPEHTCRGLDQWIRIGVLLRISLSRVNAKPSIVRYSSTLTMPGSEQLDCRRGREMERGASFPRTLPLLPGQHTRGGHAA
jgi:hypothetical protein